MTNEYTIKLNRMITNMSRIEGELDGLKGDIERFIRFENPKDDNLEFMNEAFNLACSSEAYLEEARIFLQGVKK